MILVLIRIVSLFVDEHADSVQDQKFWILVSSEQHVLVLMMFGVLFMSQEGLLSCHASKQLVVMKLAFKS